LGLASLRGSRWWVGLAKDLTWQLDLGSSTGKLDLDLRDVALEARDCARHLATWT